MSTNFGNQHRQGAIRDDPVSQFAKYSSIMADFQKDPQFPMYVAASVAGLVFLLIFLVCITRRGKKRRNLLICGPCDAGKTVIFSKLVHRKPVQTYTSMQENIGVLVPRDGRKKPLDVVDVPGHERLRFAALDRHKASARAIIYVLDSATITKGIRDATEFLFRILSDPVVHSNKTPVMVLCNKQDLALAKGSAVIERELVKEIGMLRETHAKRLDGTDGHASIDHVFLGKVGKDFAFSDLKAEVNFCEVSATKDDVSVENVQKWISRIA